jgi:hypothetical protein
MGGLVLRRPIESTRLTDKTGDAVGRGKQESLFLGHPGANFSRKAGIGHNERKKGANRNTKGGHFKRGNGGDILKEL